MNSKTQSFSADRIFSRLHAIVVGYSLPAIVVGAISMVATYPGRTHGLGMFTEPLLKDLSLDSNSGRVTYSMLGFWATLLGSLFCLPIGWLLERFGQRILLIANYLFLGIAVLILANADSLWQLFAGLLLTRGFGQAALSAVSITIVSNAHTRDRLGMAMAVYAMLSLPFHLVLINTVGWGLNEMNFSWRFVSSMTGVAIFFLISTAFMIPKRASQADRIKKPTESKAEHGIDTSSIGSLLGNLDRDAETHSGYTWFQAVQTPAFWTFGLTISLWGMIYAGSSLFNQDIFKERGFEASLYFSILSYSAIIGLGSKFVFGWLNHRVPLNWLLATTMGLTAISLTGLPFATKIWHAYAYGTLGGIASGGVALLFFSCWGTLFGHRALGYIQSTAQMMTVLASAIGPFLFASVKKWTDSYELIFFILAGLSFLLAIWAMFVPLPIHNPSRSTKE